MNLIIKNTALITIVYYCFVSSSTVLAEQKQFKRPSANLPELPSFVDEQKPQLKLPAPEKIIPQALSKKQFFKLEGIQLKENRVISSDELLSAVQSYIGRVISLSELESIRLALTEVYKAQGYINSGAILDNQHISSGIVNFTLIEGHVEKVNVLNAGRLSDQYVIDRLIGDPDQPLQQAKLQENFQSLLHDPLITHLNGVLKPGTLPGSSILDIDVTRAPQPYGAYLNFDNQTPASIGAYTGRLGSFVRNLNTYADVLGIEFSFSEGLQLINFNYSSPINRHDTRLSLDIQASQSEIIEKPFDRLNIESDFLHVGVTISQPFYKTLNRQFLMDLSYAYRINKTYVDGVGQNISEGADLNGETVVSVLRFAQHFTDTSINYALSLRSTFSVGIDVLGASNSSNFADSEFFSWIGQVHYAHKLNDEGMKFVLRGTLQLANERLLSLERFALGGFANLRGYRENYRVNDQGYATSTEFHYPLLVANSSQEHALSLVPFFDVGAAWDVNKSIKETLYSAGIGLNWSWQRLDAQLYWAHAFIGTDQQSDYDLQDDGIHFQLSTNLL